MIKSFTKSPESWLIQTICLYASVFSVAYTAPTVVFPIPPIPLTRTTCLLSNNLLRKSSISVVLPIIWSALNFGKLTVSSLGILFVLFSEIVSTFLFSSLIPESILSNFFDMGLSRLNSFSPSPLSKAIASSFSILSFCCCSFLDSPRGSFSIGSSNSSLYFFRKIEPSPSPKSTPTSS